MKKICIALFALSLWPACVFAAQPVVQEQVVEKPGDEGYVWNEMEGEKLIALKAKGDPVIAFVNGLGGTPLIELYVMFNEVNRILGGHGVPIARSLVGSYITSLEMAGCSITLLKLSAQIEEALLGEGMCRVEREMLCLLVHRPDDLHQAGYHPDG